MVRHDEESDRTVASRRHFLKLAAGTAAVAALAGTSLLPRRAYAAGLAPLNVDNPTAKAMHYVENATHSRSGIYQRGSACSNCAFFRPGSDGAQGTCELFPRFSVSPQGWCTAYQRQFS